MGATFASLTSTLPQITWLTSHKDLLFILTGLLLGISFWLMRRSQKQACPIDPAQRDACKTSKSASYYIFYFSVSMYVIGLIFSFVIPRIMYAV